MTLLTDVDNKVRKLYQVPSLLFDTIPGRVTYIIDKNGYISILPSKLNNGVKIDGFFAARLIKDD